MKTTLTPPPITPGPWVWTSDFDGAIDMNELCSEDGNRVLIPVTGWDQADKGIRCGDEKSHREGNAKLIAAAPAMAEVLARLLPDFEIDESAHDGHVACEISVGDVKAIRAALLAAGYTEVPADAE